MLPESLKMMSKNRPDEIESIRETSKIGLELFVYNIKENSFSSAVFEETGKLQQELNKQVKEFISQQAENQYDEFYYLDTEFLEDKLTALSEMNIVYAYKDFEINVKKLLESTYKIGVKEFYKWESILSFLKSKGIKPSTLKGFEEIDQLRQLNNHIKHCTSQSITPKINNIQEFKDLRYLRHYELTEFFNRINNYPYIFLENLSAEIYKNLYEFDTIRIQSIAEMFALRMDKQSANTFIEELKKFY